MSAFAVNQVTQLYAVNSVAASRAAINSATEVGKAFVDKNQDGKVFIKYIGVGGPVRSDLIDPALVKYATRKKAANDKTRTKAYTVTPDAAALKAIFDAQGGSKDVILRISIKNFAGDLSGTHNYFKHAAARLKAYMFSGNSLSTTNTATSPALVAILATQLAKSFARDIDPMVKILVGSTEVTKNTAPESLTITASSTIKIIALRPEVDPIMYKGLNDELDFDVFCGSYNDSIDEEAWGTVVDTTATDGLVMSNAVKIAALEDFALKERADNYGYMGYPYINPSKKILNPTIATTLADRKTNDAQDGYDVINIHFAYLGNNEQYYLSEKDLVLVGTTAVITSLKSALADAGITVTEADPEPAAGGGGAG